LVSLGFNRMPMQSKMSYFTFIRCLGTTAHRSSVCAVGSRTGARCSLGSAYPLLPVSVGSASLSEP
jgi:hypothetical protein